MAKRQQATRQHTAVAMPNLPDYAGTVAPYAKNIAGTIFQLAKKRDEMKMNNMLQDANTEMATFTSKWQRENSSNPFDVEAVTKLRTGYDEIFDRYSKQVSITSRGDWGEMRKRVTNQYMQSNIRWGTQQAIKNAQADVNMGFVKANNFAFESGMAGVDMGLVKGTYQHQADSTTKSLQGIGMSKAEIDDSISNFRSDYMKSYIQGVIQRDPVQAQKLLSDKSIREDIGSKEAHDLLTKMTDTQIKRIETEQKITQIQTEKEVSTALVESPDTYTVADIQRMELLGQIRSDFAKKAMSYKTGAVYGESVDPATYNRISGMISGQVKKKDGSRYSDQEVGEEIMANADKLTKETANSLSKSVATEKDTFLKNTIKLEADGLEATLMKTIGGSFTPETIKGTAKGEIEDIMYRFHKEVLEKDASPEQVREIARKYKVSALQEKDPTFEDKDKNMNISRLTLVPVNTRIVNPKTGEYMTLDKDGRWVQLPPLQTDKASQ